MNPHNLRRVIKIKLVQILNCKRSVLYLSPTITVNPLRQAHGSLVLCVVEFIWVPYWSISCIYPYVSWFLHWNFWLPNNGGPLFTNQTDVVLPQYLVKSRIRRIGCYYDRIALKSGRYIGRAAAELSFRAIGSLNLNLATSRLQNLSVSRPSA